MCQPTNGGVWGSITESKGPGHVDFAETCLFFVSLLLFVFFCVIASLPDTLSNVVGEMHYTSTGFLSLQHIHSQKEIVSLLRSILVLKWTLSVST